MQTYVYTQAAIYFLHNLDQFDLGKQTVCSHHIHVALVELAVAAFLRTIGTPHRLNLIALEGELYRIPVLHHVARKRNGQVVTQTFLRRFVCLLA